MVCKDKGTKLMQQNNNYCSFFLGACLVVDSNKRPTVDAIIAQLYPIPDKLGENFGYPQVVSCDHCMYM